MKESMSDNGRRVRIPSIPGSNVKGEAAIDWSDRQARKALLAGIVGDADRLLELSRQAQGECRRTALSVSGLLPRRNCWGCCCSRTWSGTDDGVGLGVDLKDGVSRDRMMSVHDPELATGTRAAAGGSTAPGGDCGGHRFPADHRRAVLPGNAPDNLGALELVEQSEANTGVPVEEAMATPPMATALPGRPSPLRDVP